MHRPTKTKLGPSTYFKESKLPAEKVGVNRHFQAG